MHDSHIYHVIPPSSTRSVNTHLLDNRLRNVHKGNKIRGLVLPGEEGLVGPVASARGKLFLRLDELPDGATGVEARWVFGAVIVVVGLGVVPPLRLQVGADRGRELRADVVQELLGEGENHRGGGMDDPNDHLTKRPNHQTQSDAENWRPNNDTTFVLLQYSW